MVLVQFGAPIRESSSVTGATVTTRKVRFASQPEQILWLRGMVNSYREVYLIRSRARDIAFRQRVADPRDQIAQAVAIASWVQDNITYVQELPETFQTPTTTVSEGYGDCDDFSTLIASMCESIGIMTELVGMEWGKGASRYYRHIFPRAVVVRDGMVYRVPLDATLTNPVDGTQDPIRIALAKGVRDLRIFVA
jgi:transglutaminase-like putative cysteine protease